MLSLRRFGLRTLQARILVALVAFATLPLGLVGVASGLVYRQALAEQSALELSGLARGLAGQIALYVADVAQDAQAIAALPEIVRMDPERQEPLLKELYQHYPRFTRLSTFDLTGRRLASSFSGGVSSVAERESFQAAARRGVQALEVAPALSTGRLSLLVQTPIRNAERAVVGVLGIVVDLENLAQVVEQLPIGYGGHAYVLDGSGALVLRPSYVTERSLPRPDQNLEGGPGWPSATPGRSAAPPASGGTVRYELDGSARIAGYAPVPEVGWTVYVERPEAAVLATADRIWQLTLAGLGASALLAALVAVGLASTLARPVRALAAAAQALGRGDASVALPRTGPDDGEVGTLVAAFAAMRAAVTSRTTELAISEQRVRTLYAAIACGIVVFDAEGRVLEANRPAEEALGWSRKELVGRRAASLWHLSDATGAAGAPEAEPVARAVQQGHPVWNTLVWVTRPDDGEQRWLQLHCVPLLAGDGRPVQVVASFSDITERKRAELALEHQALHDALTGLPNRVLLRKRLEQQLAVGERAGGGLALLLLDLDRFKEVNDTFGHRVGDQLLQQVAARLARALPADALVARLGGDEFAVLLAGRSAAEAAAVASQLLQALDEPLELAEQSVRIEASVGIALAPDHGDDADTLLRRADVALYAAKRSGRGYALYDPRHDVHSPARLALIADLRRAIAEDELVLHYQPLLDLARRTVVGVEALVRWQHPERGLIPPDTFIPLAEQTGLIDPLSRWVLDAALQQCRRWRQAGLDLFVAVNLSARNLQDSHLPEQVAALLARWQASPDRLEIEITESAIMADPERALDLLQRLRAMGVRIAIDDFGTGYSSLGRLKRLPVDQIKIDRSFVRDMVSDPSDRAIVRAIVDLGHHLGIEVVAEGVESPEALDQLAALGCDLAQGYWLSRPLPADALSQWLKRFAAAPGERAA